MNMRTFRALRRTLCCVILLGLLAFTAGCISIGFGGSIGGRFGSFGASVGSGIRLAGVISHSNVFRYTSFWYSRGVLVGIDPIDYVASSARESMEKGEAPEKFSPEQQYYVGRGVSASLISDAKMADLNDPKIKVQLKYLNNMAGFVNVSAPDGAGLWAGIHVGILETPRVGAYATPGGFIWITRGALDLVQTEDELAALVCHELGHVAKEHAIKAYVKDGGGKVKPNPWLKNLDKLNPASRHTGNYFGGLAEQVANNKYGEDQELEADQWGAVALQLAGYDSRAMVRLLNRVEAWEKKNPDKGAYLANHPPVKKRVDKIEDFMDDEKDLFQVKVSVEATNRRNARFKAAFGR